MVLGMVEDLQGYLVEGSDAVERVVGVGIQQRCQLAYTEILTGKLLIGIIPFLLKIFVRGINGAERVVALRVLDVGRVHETGFGCLFVEERRDA